MIYSEGTIRISNVPEDALAQTISEENAAWVDEMDDDLELGLEAVANNLRDKYGRYGVLIEIKEN